MPSGSQFSPNTTDGETPLPLARRWHPQPSVFAVLPSAMLRAVKATSLLCAGLLAAAPAVRAVEQAGLLPVKQFAEFARKHCTDCHDKAEQKGGFDMEDLLAGGTVERSPAAWHSVLERLAARDMPPPKRKERPSEAEYRAGEDWVRGQLVAHEAIALAKRPRPMRRLNSDEYNRAVQAVFGLAGVRPAAAFPPDDAVEGFTNIGDALNVSSVLVGEYLDAARAIADLALVEGTQPAAKVRVFELGAKDYSSTIRGFDPGGATTKKVDGGNSWLGDRMWVHMNTAPAGFYKVRMQFTPRGVKTRPGYTPHFQYRFNQVLVHASDAPVSEGVPATHELTAVLPEPGNFVIEFRWANGFPANGSLRPHEFVHPEWDEKTAFTRKTFGNLMRVLNKEWEQNPNAEWPFPRLTEWKVEVEGPLYPRGWPMSKFQRENSDAIAAGDAKRVGAWLLPKLFRRPAQDAEVADFATFVADAEKALPGTLAKADRFRVGLRQGIANALMSPHFLFVVEPAPSGRALTDYELAARLSFFLWGAPPDDELTALATAKKLRASLAAQTARMLADPRSAALVERFTSEWLGLAKLAGIMPEPTLYPRFDLQGVMKKDFADEPKAFMAHLLAANGSLYDLLDCDYAFLNDRLADHYHLPSNWAMFPRTQPGFATVSGGDLRKVMLPASQRGGLVTMAAFLASTSENTRTSPVRRGIWILEKIFNRPPPPPPPNVNAVLPDSGTGDTASSLIRTHAKEANCAGCHQRIDPFGFALERFDVIGEQRVKEPLWVDPANPARSVDALRAKLKLGKYAPFLEFEIDDTFRMGGIEGKGPDAVKQYLVANKERFATGFTEKLAMFALGRRHLMTDEPQLKSIRTAAMKDGFRFRTLITELVQSPMFQTR